MIRPQVLGAIPGCEQGEPPLQAELLPGGGQLNRTLRITTRAGCFVVRERLDSGPRPGADGARELACQAVAAGAGLAPRIIASAADASWLVMEFVEGRMWRREDLTDPGRLAALGARLAHLHGLVAPPIAPLDAMQVVRGQIDVICSREPAAHGEMARLAVHADRLVQTCAQSVRTLVLNHGDLNVANILGSAPLLVDWEYAQLADPLHDVACLVTYYPELRTRLDYLLGGAGLDAAGARDALEAHLGLFSLLNQLWGRAQGALHGDAAGLVAGRSAE